MSIGVIGIPTLQTPIKQDWANNERSGQKGGEADFPVFPGGRGNYLAKYILH